MMIKRFFKKLLHVIWTYGPQDYWRAVWSRTSVDEKAIAALNEVKKRYDLTVDELVDVVKAIGEVGDQLGDIPAAVKGKARKGRKPAAKKKAPAKKASPKKEDKEEK